MELRFIKDRQRAGIEAAKAEGVYKGRAKTWMTTRSVAASPLAQARPGSPVTSGYPE
ncbi:hypothetical protein [Mesorhizobium sp.]|uniref:hypothetical protein n=1 Tax=Mesorhizobium sp. TaxID=1871066 RepID=UPI00257E7EA1|nr:hypothetical protein [Mesorhizobium sp.]